MRIVTLASITVSSLALLLASAAGAEDEAWKRSQRFGPGTEVLLPLGAPMREALDDGGWWIDHIHVKKRAGLAYTRPVSVGNRDFVFTLQGPAMGKKRVGLAMELRF